MSNKSVPAWASAIIVLLVLVLMAVTNPGLDAHERGIRDHVAASGTLASKLGLGFLSSKLVAYQSYGIVSVTRFEGDLVSVGAFAGVWVIEDNPLTGRDR